MDANGNHRRKRVSTHHGLGRPELHRGKADPIALALLEDAWRDGPGLTPSPDTTVGDVLRAPRADEGCWTASTTFRRGDVEARRLEPSNPHGARIRTWSGRCNHWFCAYDCAAYRVRCELDRIYALPDEGEGLFAWTVGDDPPPEADTSRYVRVIRQDGTVTQFSPGPNGMPAEEIARVAVCALLATRSGCPNENAATARRRRGFFASVPDRQTTGEHRAMVTHALSTVGLTPEWRGPRSSEAHPAWHPDYDAIRWDTYVHALKSWEDVKLRARLRQRKEAS